MPQRQSEIGNPKSEIHLNPPSAIELLLTRPRETRIREYRYRLGQAVVFGLPVLFLQWFGSGLGGADTQRWVPVFQAILTGWITYVCAGGMLFEGVVLLLARYELTPDLAVASLCTLAFLFSAVSTLGVSIVGHPFYSPVVFHFVVVTMIAWTLLRLLSLARMENHS